MMTSFASAFPAHLFVAAALLAIGVALLDGLALAFWRRWLGGWGGDFPRSVKILALCTFLGAQYLGAAWPLLFPGTWTIPAALAAPWAYTAAALAWVGLPVFLTGVCLWFVTNHNNGGPQGTGGPERYGWAGLGYPIAYPFRDLIPDVRIFGSVAIRATTWTAFGELWLGAVTGLAIGVPLGCLLAYRFFCFALSHALSIL
ncbi:membrane hypothetical protein [uncultured Alphaproteobacteria bacterium]|uniref:Uncharacterized protein n=1 Tax=uncultured Alphaproteobacteria bacterium TaxID=91750 RepID=A0A212KBW3_9PROT|nr:membrane hypothetical protein [uncultured Alphaproteobacteria bacterium]